MADFNNMPKMDIERIRGLAFQEYIKRPRGALIKDDWVDAFVMGYLTGSIETTKDITKELGAIKEAELGGCYEQGSIP